MKSLRRGSTSMSSPDTLGDLVDTVKAYARQETVGPLRGAGRWLLFGVVAATCLGMALLFGLLGILRLSQDLGGSTLDDSWSFVHYLITIVIGLILVAITLSRVNRSQLNKDA